MASITNLQTPGVYVQEVSSFPPSVAQVPTAIPAFIGYTQMAVNNGQDLTNVPTLISSLLEYNAYFGGEYDLQAGDVTIGLNTAANFSVSSMTIYNIFYMYEALRHFYDNGGGQCYIVSVGSYTSALQTATTPPAAPTPIPSAALRGGVTAVAQYNDPTLLLFPDAVRVSAGDFYSLQQMALLQAATLQDRFAVLDLQETSVGAQPGAVTSFRNSIGINNLEYGAAYTPWVYSTYEKTVTYAMLSGHAQDTSGNPLKLENLSADPSMNQLVLNLENTNSDLNTVNTTVTSILTADGGNAASLSAAYTTMKGAVVANPVNATMTPLMTFVNAVALAPAGWAGSLNASGNLYNDLGTDAKNQSTGLYALLPQLISLEENSGLTGEGVTAGSFTPYDSLTGWLSGPASSFTGGTAFTGTASAIILAALNALDPIMTGLLNFMTNIQSAATAYNTMAQTIAFSAHPVLSNIVTQLAGEMARTPSSGAMVGVYASVDNTRGVWKAPANVSLNSVSGPSVIIDDTTQGGLNVDPIAGKSINAIRSFTGRGTIVWGARTLDGNDDNWRYISVRRFYIMVEESVKDACAAFVFEPNDANTWTKVQAMIQNYLTNLWREKALAGSKPELSFYVNVGLGLTMTQDDIDNGRMIVEIGMAPVRPAEFIVLVFTQIQQQ